MILETWLAAFARASAFAATAPLAGSGGVPKAVRAALALALTPAIASHPLIDRGTESGALLFSVLTEAAVGATFGLAAALVASAAAAAGGMIDVAIASGALAGEPVFGGGSGPAGRLYALGFACAFTATGSMTQVCERFVSASSTLDLTMTAHGVVSLVHRCVNAAIELAFPAVAAQCLGVVVAATAARAAPNVNGMMLASPIGTALVLLAVLAAAPVTFAHLGTLARAAASLPSH